MFTTVYAFLLTFCVVFAMANDHMKNGDSVSVALVRANLPIALLAWTSWVIAAIFGLFN